MNIIEHFYAQKHSIFESLCVNNKSSDFFIEQFVTLLKHLALIGEEISTILKNPAHLDALGYTGAVNVQGEQVQKLDEISNTLMISRLVESGVVCILGSEEEENFYLVPSTKTDGQFIVFFDPLDGSSNIDVNINVGTIFSIYHLATTQSDISDENFQNTLTKIKKEDILQKGSKQIASGYFIYGPATVLVYSIGDGVHAYTLTPCNEKKVTEFVLTHENIKVPQSGKEYSVNLGNYSKFPECDQKALDDFQLTHSLRYVGSLIADFHRILLKGGLFSYPTDISTNKAKLRLLYEASPLSFLIKQAGGVALDGDGIAILDKIPTNLHERTAFLFGSALDVDRYRTHFSSRHSD